MLSNTREYQEHKYMNNLQNKAKCLITISKQTNRQAKIVTQNICRVNSNAQKAFKQVNAMFMQN